MRLCKPQNTPLLLLTICSLVLFFIPLTSTHAKVSEWQRGASIMSRGPNDFDSESFRQSVAELKKLNPTHVTLIITLSQHDAQATKVVAGDETPTDAALISGIKYIHSLGLKTHLKFHIETEDHAWRAYINPPDHIRADWFTSYTNYLLKYGKIAEQYKVDMMTIGTELTNLTANDAHPKNTERWNSLIRQVRSVFSGKLTYCANSSTTLPDWTNEKARIGFWTSLDYIGISAYHGMSTSNPTVDSFKNKWNLLNTNDYSKLQKKYNRPLLFCEIGYRNVEFAHSALYDYWTKAESHENRQADLYQALFSYWDNYDYLAGVHVWHWSSDPAAGGPKNTDYTPRGKKAEHVIASWWGGQISGELADPPTEEFALRGRATPKIVQAGNPVTIYAIVDNKSKAREGLIIDIEVYNDNGQQVFQKVHEKKQFAVGQSKTYEAKWTPEIPGVYEVRIGVFKEAWKKNYSWKNKAAKIVVEGGGETPTPDLQIPENPTLSIWTPSDGQLTSGIQQFKATLEGAPLNTYHIFWRVDGGSWNATADGMTSGPHKTAYVDVSSWKWNTTNMYTLEFLARDNNGKDLASKSIVIQVVN